MGTGCLIVSVVIFVVIILYVVIDADADFAKVVVFCDSLFYFYLLLLKFIINDSICSS